MRVVMHVGGETDLVGGGASRGRRWAACGLLLLALLLAFAVIPSSASAVTKTFVGPGTDWNDPANWAPVGVPAAADDAVVDTVSATLDTGADAAVNSLAVTSPGSLNVAGTKTLAAGPGASSIAGQVALRWCGCLRLGGSSVWSAGQLQFGIAAAGGTLEVAGTLSITGDRLVRAVDFGGGCVDPCVGRRDAGPQFGHWHDVASAGGRERRHDHDGRCSGAVGA